MVSDVAENIKIKNARRPLYHILSGILKGIILFYDVFHLITVAFRNH